MPKKIIYNNKTVNLTYQISTKILKSKIPYTINEVSFEEISKEIKNHIN